MAFIPAHRFSVRAILITATGFDAYGEVAYSDTLASGSGALKQTDAYEPTTAGVVFVSRVEWFTSPDFAPAIGDKLTIQSGPASGIIFRVGTSRPLVDSDGYVFMYTSTLTELE